jgi:hypothetical protein
MSVISFREVIPRAASHKFGEAPTAEIKYVVTVDEPTATTTLVNQIGIFHTDQHPELSYLRCSDIAVSESDRHHVEVTYRYELLKPDKRDPNPLARPDVWQFSTGGAQVPALSYYHGNGNADIRPLQNSAKEFVEGLTTLEAEVRATISGNRASFPLDVAAAVSNCINSDGYLGGAPYTWQCAGISGQQQTEVVNDVEVNYWAVTAELVYRRSGWNLLIPDVGWNYLDGGELKRAWVWNDDRTEKIASGSPRALNNDGSLKADGQPPDIIGGGAGRRIFATVPFQPYFGVPPF